MSEPWYSGYEIAYIQSEDEHKAFAEWMSREHPREDGDEFYEEWRETQDWYDSFLNWAWPRAVADGRVKEE